jgi:hypothetical protein
VKDRLPRATKHPQHQRIPAIFNQQVDSFCTSYKRLPMHKFVHGWQGVEIPSVMQRSALQESSSGSLESIHNQNQNLASSLSLCFMGIFRVAAAEPTQGRLLLGTCPIGHEPQPHKHCQHQFKITAVGT